jgi:hypothetical protein
MLKLTNMRDKRQLKSILLVCVLIATSMAVVFPLTAPRVKAQPIEHRASALLEDGFPPFDTDGLFNQIVVWDQNEDHWINEDYVVNAGYTLEIPALNFVGNPTLGNEITFKTIDTRIEVYGRLITNSDGIPTTKTLFWGEGVVNWKGIYFQGGSEGNITDCTFMDAENAVRFMSAAPGGIATMIAPGITDSVFMGMEKYGVQLLDAAGYTNIENCNFFDTYDSATSLNVVATDSNIINCQFTSHGDNKSSLVIRNSKVYMAQSSFWGNGQPGNEVLIENRIGIPGSSDGTVLDRCNFMNGAPGDHLVRVDDTTLLMDNCSFDTTDGELSIFANEESGVPTHLILRNPTGDGNPGFWDDSFDNTTINVTGGSSVTLQWYVNVYVEDPDGNPIDNALVWVEDRNGDPAEPPSISTDGTGWAEWFICTELIQYNNSMTYFNPFSVSALNNSMMGYATPDPIMNMSKEITVIVPFNPIPNTLPTVSVNTPVGVQSGLVSITFILSDPDIGDDGNLSITVEFWDPVGGGGWTPATADPSSDTTDLNVGILYTFVWDSRAIGNFPDGYSTEIKIKITPYDKAGPGTPSETLDFTVDNKAPVFLTPPTASVTNNSATITWTVDENADAVVWYGLNITDDPSDLIYEQAGSTGTTSQVVDITNLKPGRIYSFVINSTDPEGNKRSSSTTGDFPYQLETEIHIQLKKGWNMISIPPWAPSVGQPTVGNVLAPIAGQYDAVQMYDILDPDPWKHNRTGKPYGNDFDEIFPIFGLWIHMKNDALFILDHKVPSTGLQEIMLLTRGWNFVGYPSVTTRSVSVALVGSYDQVQTYDASSGQWLSYDGGSGLLTDMELGRGYWIHVTAEFTWQVDYV